jgi:tetratricopeptide (TPR) repeat protein
VTAEPPAPRARKWPLLVALAALVAVAGWQGRVQYLAWDHLRAGRAALEAGDARAARARLEACLEDWPRSAEAHFLAGRAARRCGTAPDALLHFEAAAGFGYDAAEIEIERALGALAEGDYVSSDAVIRKAIDTKHPAAAEALELLVPALVAQFRLHEASQAAQLWVEVAPSAARAWRYRADLYERLRNLNGALDAYRRLVQLEPGDRAHRAAVVRLLLTTGQAPDEAARLAEGLLKETPDDPATVVQLAQCRSLEGRTEEALALLEGPLRAVPPSAPALRLRGRIESNRGRDADALTYLRRAAAAEPGSQETLYAIFLCLQRVGTPDEVRAAERAWRECEKDLRRVSELVQLVSRRPDDADLRCEVGTLFVRNGQAPEGVRWLESALLVKPDHAASHAALAAHYESVGRADLAARHRARAPR